MATHNIELFSIPNTRPQGAPAYGMASFTALPIAEVSFDRGFNVALGLDLEAKLSAEVREIVYAALSGGVSGSLGLQAQVGFPLDLFSSPGGGFAMHFRGQAEAAGYLRAEIGLDTATFTELLRDAAPGPVTDLISVFLDHVRISAGVWGHAGISAQVDAQTYCTGRLWPPDQAGFSVIVKFAAGYYYGYGLSYVTNFKLDDPAGMLDQLATRIGALAYDVASQWVEDLPSGSSERRAGTAALPYLQMLLPAFTRCLFTIGVQLADTSDTSAHQQATSEAVVAAFLAEARKVILDAVIDTAVRAAQGAFADTTAFLNKVQALPAEQQAQVLGELGAFRWDVWALTDDDMSATDLLDRITDCIPPLQSLLNLEVFTGPRETLEAALGLMWAASALARRVAGWVDDPATVVTDLAQDTSAVPPLPNGPVAAWLASKVPGKTPGTGFTVSDLVTVLVNSTPLEDVDLPPELEALLDWVRRVLGVDPGDLLAALLRGQVQDGADATSQIVDRLAQMGADIVRDKVLPDLLTRVAAGAHPAVRELLDDVVAPALLGTPTEILPALATLGTDQQAKRVREAASVLLIQTFLDLVVNSTDVLLNEALTAAPPWLDEAAEQIRQVGEDYPAYSVVASTAAAAVTGIDLLPADVAELLGLSSRAMTLWNDHQRAASIRLLRQVMRLRLGDPATRDQTLTEYLSTSNAPNPAEMTEAILELADGMWLLMRELLPASLLLIPHHAEHQLEAWTGALVKVWTQAIVEVNKFIDGWPQQADEWLRKLEVVAADIAEFAGQVADLLLALPGQLLDLVDQFFDAIDAEAYRIIAVATTGYPDPVPDLVRAAYQVAFAPLRWLLEAPLEVLADVSDLLRLTAAEQLGVGRVDPASLRESLRRRILRQRMATIRVPLVLDAGPLGRIDLGTVTLSDTWLRSAVADLVLNHPAVTATINDVSDRLTKQRAAQSAQLTAARGQAEGLSKAQAVEKLTKTSTNRPPEIRIFNPIDGVSRPDSVRISLVVDNINRTFVEPPLGAPQRVQVRLNGQRIGIDPGWWIDESIMQFLGVTVLPTPARAFAVLGWPVGPFYVEGQPGTPGKFHTFEAKAWREPTVIGRPGLNTLEVLVTDGAGHQATAARHSTLGPPPSRPS
jgi:hypothetical protein